MEVDAPSSSEMGGLEMGNRKKKKNFAAANKFFFCGNKKVAVGERSEVNCARPFESILRRVRQLVKKLCFSFLGNSA